MKLTLRLLLLLLFAHCGWAQKSVSHLNEFTAKPLAQALKIFEQQFDVRYSYADSLVLNQKLNLPKAEYTLEQIHQAVAQQTHLKITSIDGRYFALSSSAEEPLLQEQLQEVLIDCFLSKGIKKSNNQIQLFPQKIEALPGVTDTDIMLSLQQLPGVKSPNETASGLYVRGGSFDQNLILWDGIRMYHPGHLYGMISAFNPNIPQTVNYQNKGTDARYGERLSSLISIQSTDKISDKTTASAGINALNADAYVQTPLVKNKLGLQLAGRKSYTQWLQTPTFNSLADKVFQNTQFKDFSDRNKFGFEDFTAKLNYRPSDKADFSATALWIDNQLDFNTLDKSITQNQKMNISNQGYSFIWNQKYSTRFSQRVLLHYSGFVFSYRKTKFPTASTFEQFEKRNRVTDSGLEINWNFKANEPLGFEAGYQLSGYDISHSFNSLNQDINIQLDQKQGFNRTHTFYVAAKYEFKKWLFQTGLRYSRFSVLASENWEPRLFIQRKLTSSLTWQGSYEQKSQLVSQVRESIVNDLSLENYVWVLGDNQVYPLQKSQQYTSGLIYKTGSWVFDADFYYKTATGLTSLTFGFLNPFDFGTHQGQSFTKGIDVLIQKNTRLGRIWMTYSYQDSQNRFDGVNDEQYFPTNADIKHAFSLSFFRKWNRFSLTGGWFWHTGKPYSELDSSNKVTGFNTQRLPAYHRFDVSGIYEFAHSKKWSAKTGFSIYNLYNRKSLLAREYERQYATAGSLNTTAYKLQEYYSLGFTPNVFVRFQF